MSFECQPHCRRSSAPLAALGLQGSGVLRLTSFRHLSGEADLFSPVTMRPVPEQDHDEADDPGREGTTLKLKNSLIFYEDYAFLTCTRQRSRSETQLSTSAWEIFNGGRKIGDLGFLFWKKSRLVLETNPQSPLLTEFPVANLGLFSHFPFHRNSPAALVLGKFLSFLGSFRCLLSPKLPRLWRKSSSKYRPTSFSLLDCFEVQRHLHSSTYCSGIQVTFLCH